MEGGATREEWDQCSKTETETETQPGGAKTAGDTVSKRALSKLDAD
jgi:hypothetical protein